MPTPRSITSSKSFKARALDAERARTGMLAICLAFLLAAWIARRVVGGRIASHDDIFYPILVLFSLGLALSLAAFVEVTRRRLRGIDLPPWRFVLGSILDIGVPFSVLLVHHLRDPAGLIPGIAAPAVLIVPIVIFLSVLRLRPVYSLLTGLGAACAHWTLAVSAFRRSDSGSDALPQFLAYGALLALTGAAASVLASFTRRYIRDAVEEAEAAERSARQLSVLEHELSIAHEIQQGLLPPTPPVLPGFDVAGLARPATQAGGDYYDWQSLPDGRVVIAIADVTGHGIGPALVMAVCRAYARATAPTARDTEDFLHRMNNLIVQDVSGGRFITMAVAIVSQTGDIELLSAGHGPTLLWRAAEKRVEQFTGDGVPLGIMDGELYRPAARLKLAPGDALVLITDGFMERSGPTGELFGTARLAESLARNAGRPAREILDAIDAEVTAFAAGTPQSDDMTIVVMRKNETAP